MQVMEVPMKVAVHLPLRPSFNDMAKRGELAEAVAEALAQIARDHGAIVTVGEVASRSYPGRAEPGGPPAVVVPDPRRYKDTDANGRLLPDELYTMRDEAGDVPTTDPGVPQHAPEPPRFRPPADPLPPAPPYRAGATRPV